MSPVVLRRSRSIGGRAVGSSLFHKVDTAPLLLRLLVERIWRPLSARNPKDALVSTQSGESDILAYPTSEAIEVEGPSKRAHELSREQFAAFLADPPISTRCFGTSTSIAAALRPIAIGQIL